MIVLLSIGGMLIGGGVKGIVDNRKRKTKYIEHTPVYSRY